MLRQREGCNLLDVNIVQKVCCICITFCLHWLNMVTTSQLRIWVTALLLAWGGVAFAQGPLAQGWGVGVDASRLLGGHAVVQVERAQSSEWLWQVAAGPHVGTVNGHNPFWKGLKGDVLSGSVVSVGS